MNFFSKEVRHLGRCPRLVVGVVHFLTHFTISWGCVPTTVMVMAPATEATTAMMEGDGWDEGIGSGCGGGDGRGKGDGNSGDDVGGEHWRQLRQWHDNGHLQCHPPVVC